MAPTSLQLLPHLHTNFLPNRKLQTLILPNHLCIKCTSNPNPNSTPEPKEEFPSPKYQTTTPPENFPIEKRRRSEILGRRDKKPELSKAEPPNFEIGWKRTKPIQPEKPLGHVIVDFLEKLEELMAREEFGSTALLAKAGEIVAVRAREEAEVLRDEGKVDERLVTELSRVLRLMEMDLAMVSAAVKEDTLAQRLTVAKSRCRQAILVASSF